MVNNCAGTVLHVARWPGEQFAGVFDAIREMMGPPEGKKRPIGFVHGKEDGDE